MNVAMEEFWALCKAGSLEEARGLLSSHPTLDIHAVDDYAFQWAYWNGHLEVAQWLVGLGGVDVHAVNDQAFRWSCWRGWLELAQWLWGLGGVNIHAENDYAFRFSCENGRLEVARWLLSVDPCTFSSRVMHDVRLCSWSRTRTAWCS
jgi:hypothetical protein